MTTDVCNNCERKIEPGESYCSLRKSHSKYNSHYRIKVDSVDAASSRLLTTNTGGCSNGSYEVHRLCDDRTYDLSSETTQVVRICC
jgi:hypothetical protein